LPTITLDHPPAVGSYRLDKIFGDIPARLQTFTYASVRHYRKGKISLTKDSLLSIVLYKIDLSLQDMGGFPQKESSFLHLRW